jgi:hypothetical protein
MSIQRPRRCAGPSRERNRSSPSRERAVCVRARTGRRRGIRVGETRASDSLGGETRSNSLGAVPHRRLHADASGRLELVARAAPPLLRVSAEVGRAEAEVGERLLATLYAPPWRRVAWQSQTPHRRDRAAPPASTRNRGKECGYALTEPIVPANDRRAISCWLRNSTNSCALTSNSNRSCSQYANSTPALPEKPSRRHSASRVQHRPAGVWMMRYAWYGKYSVRSASSPTRATNDGSTRHCSKSSQPTLANPGITESRRVQASASETSRAAPPSDRAGSPASRAAPRSSKRPRPRCTGVP